MPKRDLVRAVQAKRKGIPMSDKWLRCKVLKGMFSDEVAVQVLRKHGEPFSAFVPRESVRGTIAEGVGSIRVRVFRRKNSAWAVLPTDYATTIAIDEKDLVPA